MAAVSWLRDLWTGEKVVRKVSCVLLVSSVLFLIAVQGASADVIFDTLGLPIGGGPYPVNSTQSKCQGFDVGAGSYWLNNVVLGMDNGTSGVELTDFSVTLWDASGTDANGSGHSAPGNLLATLAGATDPYVAGNYTYTPTSAFLLDPNTTYYVVASTSNETANYLWNYTADNPTVGSGWWGYSVVEPADPWTMYSYNLNLMQVNADPAGTVPEPGTMALLLMGLPVGLLWRKRKA